MKSRNEKFNANLYGTFDVSTMSLPGTKTAMMLRSSRAGGPVLGDLGAADGINRSVDVKFEPVSDPKSFGPEVTG